ncbi:M56 family metallopeptidase [Colwellia sp. RSH04]|uniref:M56 family metallopeptidase n=1 Tax=Colwellia sp. RSH04 TaxID=2305464 RepID=UPI000E579DFF|nr:M56 family metallopeptidase [Colwellia sp. RSH04]RHW76858.1 TonB family protein [Colwellia sp. RSH04]
MLEHLLATPYFYSLALTLLHFLWQGVLVAFALKAALLIIDKNKSQLRYALSATAMFANLVLAIVTFIIVFPDDAVMQASSNTPIALTTLVNELTQDNTLLNYQELIPSLVAHSLPFISLLWMVCVLSLAGKLLIEMRNVNKLPTQGSIVPEQALLARFNELAQQISLKKTPRLLISIKIDVPMAIGWFKPVVLIPAGMVTGLNAAQLEMLMLHELAHIRRHDYLVNFIQTVIELLFFFHPGVSWIAKQMRNEREYCSDDIAVQHCGDPIAYAHTLADTASLCANRHHHTIPSMAMAASGGDLKQRVLRLVDHHCAPTNDVSKWFAGISIFFVILFVMSNKLLTFPYAQKWSNEFPWSKPSTKLATASNKPNKDKANHLKSGTTALADDSIAQQLLSNQTVEQTTSGLANQYNVDTREEPLQVKTDPLIVDTFSETSVTTTNKNQDTFSRDISRGIENNTENLGIVEKQFEDNTSLQSNTVIEQPIIRTKSNAAKTTLALKTSPSKNNDVAKQDSIINKDNDQLLSNTLLKEPSKSAITTSNEDSSKHHALLTSQTSKSINLSDSAPSAIEVALDSSSALTTRNTFENPYQDQLNELGSEPVATKGNDIFEGLAKFDKIPASTSSLSVEQIKQPVWYEAEQVKTADPVYPSLAKRKGIEVEVKVNFTIDAQGSVKNIQFVQQNKVNYFKNSIRSAIKKWRFLPAKIGDKPVESQMSKIFSFSLKG